MSTDLSNIGKHYGKRFCCYKGCFSDQKLTRNGAISFFSFPIKDTERCSTWITHTGREEFRYLTPRELQNKRVCELHFKSDMFSNDFKTNLIKTAVPIDFRVLSVEPIQIIDDDDDGSDEGESGIVSETSSNNINYENDQENGDVFVIEPSCTDVKANMSGLDVELNIANETQHSVEECEDNVAHSVPTKDVDEQSNEEQVNLEAQLQNLLSLNKQYEKLRTTTASNKSNTSEEMSESVENVNDEKRNNTKFHNLPPQTTQSDFYFQQCPVAEETNSFSEPPDGELPLFVQQDSLASLADERPNSSASEPPSKKRKRDKDNDDLADQMRDTMKHLLSISALLNNNNEDEFELFGKSVALQLKKMSICTALTAQAEIQHLLSRFRINEIQKKTKEKSAENEDETEATRPELLKTISQEDKLGSPQLYLNCTADISENQEGELG